jgi:hypothetical protein
MNTKRGDILLSPGFVGGLCLLVNDFFLKHLWANFFTGKLSDFAGLFIFPLFWAALFPKYRRAIYAATAVAFTIWKSALSQPLIDYWNALAILPLSRTVDLGDLIALAVLPISYIYFERAKQLVRQPVVLYFIAAISIFAFTATSYRENHMVQFSDRYDFAMPKVSLLRKMYQLDRAVPEYEVSTCSVDQPESQRFNLKIPAKFCNVPTEAEIVVFGNDASTTVALMNMTYFCAEREDQEEVLRQILKMNLSPESITSTSKVCFLELLPENYKKTFRWSKISRSILSPFMNRAA